MHPNPKSKAKPKVVMLHPETITVINDVSLALDERQRYVVAAAMDLLTALPVDERVGKILEARRRLAAITPAGSPA
jgi:hypothetical protein